MAIAPRIGRSRGSAHTPYRGSRAAVRGGARALARACVDVYEDAWRLSDGYAELERGLRDARLGPIGGGTDEIMREIVGRSLY
jgi:alkylation response protein AidB-like acyl-CoA dehydrogenase